MRALVIAENYDQYKESKYFPESKYINDIKDLYGYRDTILVKIGTWYKKWNMCGIETIEQNCNLQNIKIFLDYN